MFLLADADSFEYLCFESTTIRKMCTVRASNHFYKGMDIKGLR